MASSARAAAEPSVVVVFGDKQEASARLISDELSLVGIGVRRVPGGELQATQILSSEEAPSTPNAVISIQAEGTSIWVKDSSTDSFLETEPVVVASEPGESADSRALRVVELLRGRMLEGHEIGEAKQDALSRFSVTVGPTFQLGSYVEVSWGLAADAAMWFGYVGVGPFLTMAPFKSGFRSSPEKLTLTQATLGVQARGIVFVSATELFTAQLLGRVGGRRMTFYEEKGMKADRFQGSSGALVFGVGADFSFKLTSHVRLGMGIGSDLGFTLAVPQDGPEPVEPAKKVPKELADARNTDVLFWTSGAITFQF